MSLPRSPEHWRLPLRTVSPTFIAGARPNEQAELRLNSIRGALRAWYRLLVGPERAADQRSDPNRPEDSGLSEARIFGGVARGEGQGRLQLALDAAPPTGEMAWRSREHQRSNRLGLAYLGFSLDMGRNQRVALPPDTRFTLRLIWPAAPPSDLSALAAGALWLWLSLGGLGSRARRGFGSLALADPPRFEDWFGAPLSAPPEFPEPVDAAGSPEALAQALASGLRGLARWAPTEPARIDPDAPVYRLGLNAPPPERARILVWAGTDGRGWKTAAEAHDAFGQAFATFRRERGVDWLRTPPSKGRGSVPGRAAFGLPLAFRYRNAPGRMFLPATGGRAPSPLLARVSPLADGRCVVTLTLLAGAWPGRDVPLTEGRGHFRPEAGIDLPHRFLDHFRPAWEVRW